MFAGTGDLHVYFCSETDRYVYRCDICTISTNAHEWKAMSAEMSGIDLCPIGGATSDACVWAICAFRPIEHELELTGAKSGDMFNPLTFDGSFGVRT